MKTLMTLRAFLAALLICGVLLSAPQAFAAGGACTSPTGAEGDIIYNDDYDIIQYCSGGNAWVKLGGAAGDSRIGTLTANKWCAVNAGGTAIDCTQNAPSGGGLSGGTSGYLGVWSGATSMGLSSATAGQQLFWDGVNNRLGIGTTAPSYPFTVSAAAQNNVIGAFVDNTSGLNIGSSSAAGMSIGVGRGLWGNNSELGLGYGNGPIVFYTGTSWTGAERMRITSAGNVGIGTNSPGSRLDVRGVNGAAAVWLGNFGTGAGTGVDGNVASGTIYGIVNQPDYAITGNTTNFRGLYSVPMATVSAGMTLTNGLGAYITGVQKTGTGTLTNNYGLYIDSVSGGTNNYSLYNNSTANSYFAGKVGIGTTAPDANAILDVASTTSAMKLPTVPTATLSAMTTPSAGLIAYDSTSNTIKLRTNSAWVDLATGGGALSGGTSGYLGVWSGATSMGLSSTTAGQQLFWDGTNNRLGIGTATPGYDLSVSKATSSGGNVAVQAQNTDNTTATSNAFVQARSGGSSGGDPYLSLDIAGEAGYSFGIDNSDSNKVKLTNSSGGPSNGTALMTIDASGNVGIGTASPAADTPLHIVSTSAGTSRRVLMQNVSTTTGTGARYDLSTGTANSYSILGLYENTTNGPFLELATGEGVTGGMYFTSGATATDKPIIFRQAASERMRIAANGFIGIGIAAPDNILHIKQVTNTSTASGLKITDSASGNSGYMWEDASGNLRIDAGASAGSNMILNSGGVGKIGIGTTVAPAQKLEVNGNVLAAAYLYSSDRRLKDDITPLTGMLDKVSALEPVSFVYKADASHAKRLGLIAQDVQGLFPEVVNTDAKGMMSIDYPGLVGPMIGAIKELKAENDALKAQNADILKRLEKLEAASAH